MAFGIYKQGQGYWTRLMTAIAGGTIVAMGVAWMWQQIPNLGLGSSKTIYVQGGATIAVLGSCGWLLYYLVCVKPKVGDFLIATEGEMKKVNWSTRREIMASTWVVIGLTFFIAVLIFILDYLIFTPFFRWINVLEG